MNISSDSTKQISFNNIRFKVIRIMVIINDDVVAQWLRLWIEECKFQGSNLQDPINSHVNWRMK